MAKMVTIVVTGQLNVEFADLSEDQIKKITAEHIKDLMTEVPQLKDIDVNFTTRYTVADDTPMVERVKKSRFR